MGKGSGNRVRDTKRYEENYNHIDWGDDWGPPRGLPDSIGSFDVHWSDRSIKFHEVKDGDGDDGNSTDEAVGTH